MTYRRLISIISLSLASLLLVLPEKNFGGQWLNAALPEIVFYPSSQAWLHPFKASSITEENKAPKLFRINDKILSQIRRSRPVESSSETSSVERRSRYEATSSRTPKETSAPVPESTNSPDKGIADDETIDTVFADDPFMNLLVIRRGDQFRNDLNVKSIFSSGAALSISPSPTTASGSHSSTANYRPRQVPGGTNSATTPKHPSAAEGMATQTTTFSDSPSETPPPKKRKTEEATDDEPNRQGVITGQEIPLLEVQENIWVPDYSNDSEFARRLQTFSHNEVDRLNQWAASFPNRMPMPCMAHTAHFIDRELDRRLKLERLSESDKAVLRRLRQELKSLSPAYPYLESLAITFRFLHYCSFLDFSGQVKEFGVQLPQDQICTFDNQDDFFMPLSREGVESISLYQYGCTLEKLEALPWNKLTENNDVFEKALAELYFCKTLFRTDGFSGFVAFRSARMIIPYPYALDLAFFNNTAGLPVILVAFSTLAHNHADDLQLSQSSYFEHDLFHGCIQIKSTKGAERIKTMTGKVRQFYQLKDHISPENFSGLELLLFLICHERGNITPENFVEDLALFTGPETLDKEMEELFKEYRKVHPQAVYWSAVFLFLLEDNILHDDVISHEALIKRARVFRNNLPEMFDSINIDTDLQHLTQVILDNENWFGKQGLSPLGVLRTLNQIDEHKQNNNRDNNERCSLPDLICYNLSLKTHIPKAYEELLWIDCYLATQELKDRFELSMQAWKQKVSRHQLNLSTLHCSSPATVTAFINKLIQEKLVEHSDENLKRLYTEQLADIAAAALANRHPGYQTMEVYHWLLEDYSEFWQNHMPSSDDMAGKQGWSTLSVCGFAVIKGQQFILEYLPCSNFQEFEAGYINSSAGPIPDDAAKFCWLVHAQGESLLPTFILNL